MVEIRTQRISRVVQGDIIRDVEQIECVTLRAGIVEVQKIAFPLVVVLTQDCDLEQDFRFRWARAKKPSTHDKYLLSVLVAPLYNAEHVFTGEHLSELGLKMQAINRKTTEGRYLVQNERLRYHFLDFPGTVPVVPSIVDFKHYFSANVEALKKQKREKFVCRLSELFREDLSVRFAGYLSRIGLPD
jgi:hypothetical protein